MVRFNDSIDVSHYERLEIERLNRSIWTIDEFRHKKARWHLVGYLQVNDYYSREGFHFCYDSVAGADTKAELLLQCALRGIETR